MKTIGYIFVCLLALFLSFSIGRNSVEPSVQEVEIIKRDTLTILQIDTITIIKPQPYRVEVIDTIYIEKQPQGSVFVQEIKEYKDSTYYAKISGINAFLEEIRVYPRTEYKYIANTEIMREKPKKWGLGVQAGYGIGRNGLQPYIGVGISYNLIRF